MKKKLLRRMFIFAMFVALFFAMSIQACYAEPEGELTHSHFICGAEECSGHLDGITHGTEEVFQPLTGSSLIGSGSKLNDGCYYLSEDVRLNSTVLIDGNVTLCLNGKCIDITSGWNSIWGAFTLNEESTLNICDCDSSQIRHYVCYEYDETTYSRPYVELTDDTDANSVAGGLVIGNISPLFYIRKNAELNIYGGNYIEGYRISNADGGLIKYSDDADVRIYGGYMEANCIWSAIIPSGNSTGTGNSTGNIYMYGGTLTGVCSTKLNVTGNFYMYGGEIFGEDWSSSAGGSAQSIINGDAYIYGGTLATNQKNGLLEVTGTLHLKDNPVFNTPGSDIKAEHIDDQGYSGQKLYLWPYNIYENKVLVTSDTGLAPDPGKYVLADITRNPNQDWRLDFNTESNPESGVVKIALKELRWYDEDGSELTGSQYPNYVEKNSVITMPVPEKEGKLFLGWRYDEDSPYSYDDEAYRWYWYNDKTVSYNTEFRAVYAHELTNIGTETNPVYLISNEEDLNAYLALLEVFEEDNRDERYEQYLGSNVTYLVADENGSPTSFEVTTNGFTDAKCMSRAVFDGNQSTITYDSQTFHGGWAFIPMNAGVIKNLTLKYQNCTWDELDFLDEELRAFGGISYYNYGMILNCGVQGSLKFISSENTGGGNKPVSQFGFGGIAGVDGGVIQNSYSTLDLDAGEVALDMSDEYSILAGGIAGRTCGMIFNCYSAGEMKFSDDVLNSVSAADEEHICAIGTVIGGLQTGARALLEYPDGWTTFIDKIIFGSSYGIGDRLIGIKNDYGDDYDDNDLVDAMYDFSDLDHHDFGTWDLFVDALNEEFRSAHGGKSLSECMQQILSIYNTDNLVISLTDEEMKADTGLLKTLNDNRAGYSELAEWFLSENINEGYPYLFPEESDEPQNRPSGNGGGSGSSPGAPELINEGHSAYMQGDDLGYFRPDAKLTRAEAAVIFYNLLEDRSKGNITADFIDVDSSKWYAKAVNTLASRAILYGYGDGTFRPDSNITRAEFSAIVSRFDDLISGTAEFTDVSSDHWAYKYIESDAAKGWITGYEDGTFRPEAYITRAEAVTLIDRALERVPDKSFIDNNIGDIKVFKDVKKEHWAYYWIIEATNGHDCSKDDIDNEIWKNVIN